MIDKLSICYNIDFCLHIFARKIYCKICDRVRAYSDRKFIYGFVKARNNANKTLWPYKPPASPFSVIGKKRITAIVAEGPGTEPKIMPNCFYPE